jgi:transposase
MTGKQGSSPESIVREIKRQTRWKFTAEEKTRIVLEGLRGEASIADLCRKEGIHPTMYYKWRKALLEAAKRQLNGDTVREAGSDEVTELRLENGALKMLAAELTLRNRTLKKSLRVWNPDPSIYEIHAVGEDGDHPDGRGVLAERQTYIARDRCSPHFFLRVVKEIQGRGL